jgi:hypothetical protein
MGRTVELRAATTRAITLSSISMPPICPRIGSDRPRVRLGSWCPNSGVTLLRTQLKSRLQTDPGRRPRRKTLRRPDHERVGPTTPHTMSTSWPLTRDGDNVETKPAGEAAGASFGSLHLREDTLELVRLWRRANRDLHFRSHKELRHDARSRRSRPVGQGRRGPRVSRSEWLG